MTPNVRAMWSVSPGSLGDLAGLSPRPRPINKLISNLSKLHAPPPLCLPRPPALSSPGPNLPRWLLVKSPKVRGPQQGLPSFLHLCWQLGQGERRLCAPQCSQGSGST